MRRVSSAEFVRNFSTSCDEALLEPVVLTRNGRDRLVVASVEQYRHLLSLALLNAKDEAESQALADVLDTLVPPKVAGRAG
jgi:PHD/YefM family antitoxin component YafN of YafNO toxin-antitoxin module